MNLLPILLAATSAWLWDQYQQAPNTHPNIPNCSYAGYAASERPLPRPKIVANVRDAGAKGDGLTDDTGAFRKALNQAAQAGAGAVFIPAGKYRIEGFLHLKDSGVVLRGEGTGTTILDFPHSMTQVIGPQTRAGKSAWSWSGGSIWIGPADTFDAAGRLVSVNPRVEQDWEYWRHGPKLAAVTAPANIGDDTVTVDNPAGLRPGMLVLLTWDNPADFSLLKHIAGHPTMDGFHWPGAKWIIPPDYPAFRWPVEIRAVAGNRVQLRQPLRLAVRPEWKVRLEGPGAHVTEVGVEHLTIQCHAPYGHRHLMCQGFNAIYINRAVHCFVRDVEIRSTENGVNVASSKHITVTGVKFTGPEQHHHTLACRVSSHDCLFEDFVVEGPHRVKHGINTEWLSSGNVWRRARMLKGTFDSHRALSFDSIRTDITLANDADGAGGANEAGPFLGKRVVHWNVRVENSPRPNPAEFVCQPEGHPMGALVGIQGVAPMATPPPAMPRGDKGCLQLDFGKVPTPPDLFEAQLKLRRR